VAVESASSAPTEKRCGRDLAAEGGIEKVEAAGLRDGEKEGEEEGGFCSGVVGSKSRRGLKEVEEEAARRRRSRSC
jgi:hypothetical protein